jgi:uncharacterized protein (DUF1697 family)
MFSCVCHATLSAASIANHDEEVATPRHVALLRAINVGGHTVRMEQLRSLFEELSFTEVSTFIASGNVLFDARSKIAAGLERRIERHLEQSLGYAVATFVRTPSELAAAVEHEAFPAPIVRNAHALWIGFLKEPPGAPALDRLMALACKTDDFRVHGREVHWLRRATSSEAIVTGASVEKALGSPMTTRNITTVRKLAGLSR